MDRREFVKGSAFGLAGLALPGGVRRGMAPAWRRQSSAPGKKVIVLGMDGMDPVLLMRFIEQGLLPNFKRALEGRLAFSRLRTTMPPQSPVAWSSFITGTMPGGHGIFDFVHRDPKTFGAYLSTSRSFEGKKRLRLGRYALPLSSGHVDLMRRGRPFWSILEEHGIDASLFQIPANFPVEEGGSRIISGMGTPDLLGTYGTFTYYTDSTAPFKDAAGGKTVKVNLVDHAFKSRISGPKNVFSSGEAASEVEFQVRRDPSDPAVIIEVQDKRILLKQGEWSEWLPLRFELLPLFAGVSGMVRFFVKEVHPRIKIYVSPINVDPANPALPICAPGGYSRELTEAVGRFYTQGFPADTKALSLNVLSDDEYLGQARIVLEENLQIFEHQLKAFSEGFFFFYFSSTDQNAHMLWRNMDPAHPLYVPDASPEVKNGVAYFYQRMDQVLARVLSKVDANTALFVLSDHGFAPFYREFHLSTWLARNGYTALKPGVRPETSDYYACVDWGKTAAYALGINGIYLNLKGRERDGSLDPGKARAIKAKLIADLAAVRDPATGAQVVLHAYDSEDLYSGPYAALAPDVVVGYASEYRISDEAVLGKFPSEIIGDRKDKWSADHCMDSSVVPGVLLSSRPLTRPDPAIWDLAPSILKAFGIPAPQEMDGRAVI